MKFFALVLTTIIGMGGAFADPRMIEVSTFAERAVDPDLLRMNVEVWSKSATASRAQSLAAEEMKRVQAALDQFKIRKEDMQTIAFSFGPEYVWDNSRGQNRLTGFRSTQTLQVILRKTEQGGKFVDALTQSEKGGSGPNAEAGATVNSIQWDSSKRDDSATAALADAVKSARRKADELAKAAGVRIRGVYRISHAVEAAEPPRPMFAQASKMMEASAGPATSLTEGQVKVRVNVGVAYEISAK